MSHTRMKDADRSHQQLVRQLEELRSRVVELEAAEKEWNQTAAALRKSEEAFRTIFDHSNDGILVVDADHDKIIEVNSKACDMLGYAREELLSLPMSAIHPDEMPRVKAFAKHVLTEGVGWTNVVTREGIAFNRSTQRSRLIYPPRRFRSSKNCPICFAETRVR